MIFLILILTKFILSFDSDYIKLQYLSETITH